MKPTEKILIGIVVWLAFALSLPVLFGQLPIEKIVEQGKLTGQMEFPAGTHKHFPAVVLDGSGFRITGAGSAGNSPSAKDRSITYLEGGGFVGPFSKFRFEDLAFVGQFHHIEGLYGSGSGRGSYEHCSFKDSNILAGSLGQNFNADQITFRDVTFFDSTFQNLGSQNVDYIFENCTIVRCRPAFFLVDGGGKIFFRNLTVIDSGDVCRVSGNGSVFGPENGVITFDGVDYDAGHDTANGQRDCLVNDVNGHYGKGRIVSASNVVFNRRYPGTLLKMTGKTEWSWNFHSNSNLYIQPAPEGN